MTRRQLVDVVAQYAEHLPGWAVIHRGQVIAREAFPIRQEIGFEALNSGAYRPSHAIVAMPAPPSAMLFGFLSVPRREVQYKWHDKHRLEVLAKMEAEFIPNIRQPLDILEVTSLCQATARPVVSDDLMLAILFAWEKRYGEAIDKCRQMQSRAPPSLAPRLDWEASMKNIGLDLVVAIEAGAERDLLRRLAMVADHS